MAEFTKTATGVLDYGFDWTTWLDGDTISTSVWAIDNNDSSSLVIDSESETSAIATVVLSGGTLGRTYEVTNTITTTASFTSSRTLKLTIGKRYK